MSDPWKRNLPVPFFSQREVRYRWQRIAKAEGETIPEGETPLEQEYNLKLGIEAREYSANEHIGFPVSLAWMSCNMVSLCMVLHYFGITDDTPDQMLGKFFEANDKAFRREAYDPDAAAGTEAARRGPNRLQSGGNLKEFAQEAYGLPGDYVRHTSQGNGSAPRMTLEGIKREIARGYPVWMSCGVLRESGISGHILVVRGFTGNGDVIVNDPWGDPVDNRGAFRTSGVPGLYDHSVAGSLLSEGHSRGLGSGDNSVIRYSEMEKVCGTEALNQTMTIRYPHQWSFPVRHDKNPGAPWRFSAPGDGAGVADGEGRMKEIRHVREERIREMLSKERFKGGGYPVTRNGRWHDGIHIEKRGGTPVYAAGPGRLIAARAVEERETPGGRAGTETFSPSACFTLIKHHITIDSRAASFFSQYLHLAPETGAGLRARIRARFSFGTPFETGDWIDQIIRHIHGKAVIVRPAHENKAADGSSTGIIDEGLPQLYAYNGSGAFGGTGERIGTRRIVYLCPTAEGLLDRLRNIGGDDSDTALGELFAGLDSIGSYVETIEGNPYYAVFHGEDRDGQSEWSLRYIKKTNEFSLIGLNREEFMYWGRKLAALLRGETVTFDDEDSDIRSRTDADQNDRNADYHLEVGSRTKLGVTGNHPLDALHFEVFSERNDIVTDTNDPATGSRFITVTDNDTGAYFERRHIVGLLKEAGVLREDFFTEGPDRLNFSMGVITGRSYHSLYVREEARDALQHTICVHLNSYTDPREDEEWINTLKRGTGSFEESEEYYRVTFGRFKFIDRSVIRAMRLIYRDGISSDMLSTFYHPVRFLAWLDAKYVERAVG